MDLSNIKYDKRLYDMITGPMKSLSEFMAEHYVELMKFFVLVNVPSFVYALWTVVKPILPERTIQKVGKIQLFFWKFKIFARHSIFGGKFKILHRNSKIWRDIQKFAESYTILSGNSVLGPNPQFIQLAFGDFGTGLQAISSGKME